MDEAQGMDREEGEAVDRHTLDTLLLSSTDTQESVLQEVEREIGDRRAALDCRIAEALARLATIKPSTRARFGVGRTNR